MVKLIFMLASKDLPNEMPAFEKWYLRYHAAEVIYKDGPWLTRFIAYRPLPVIPQALSYGYYNMRVIEAWFRSVEERVPKICSALHGKLRGQRNRWNGENL